MSLFKKHSVSTNRKTLFSRKRSAVEIVRIGKDFFLPNSSILMPAGPGTNNTADEIKKAAEKKEGILSLAAVFNQLWQDPRNRLVIAGFADDSDNDCDIPKRFALGQKRANSVLDLLQGRKEIWGRDSASGHRIEDYKRILRHIHLSLGWNCDPGAVDNSWNDATHTATKNFVLKYKALHVDPDKGIKASYPENLSRSLYDQIKDDSDHKWTKPMWRAVYDLYYVELGRVLQRTPKQIKDRRLIPTWFISSHEKTVGCGPSFPLEKAGSKEKKKNKYKADPFRGVEVLLFKQDELPGKKEAGKMRLKCPAKTDAPHKAKQCPIYYGYHFTASYLDLAHVAAIPYHLKFTYYDRVHKKVKEVPNGVVFEVHDVVKKGSTVTKNKVDTVSTYHAGVHTLKIPDNPDRTSVSFRFKAIDTSDATKQLWVYSKDKDTAPKIVSKKKSEVDALAYKDRIKYYDLPKEWSSENYWTRYKEGNTAKGERFEKTIKDKLKLKPFAGKKDSKADNPLTFSLDDVVLVDENGKQNINDNANTGHPKDQDKDGNPVALSDNSRITIFHINDSNLVVYKPETDDPYFSQNKFKANLIADCPTEARMVVFCGDFYGITDKRAGQTPATFKPAKKQIKGCRAAYVKDATSHLTMSISSSGAVAPYLYFAKSTGHFDLIYVHNGCVVDEPDNIKVRSYLIIYWNGRFVKSGAGVTDDEVKTFAKEGLINSKTRWESKGYTIEPQTLDAQSKGKVQIKPVFHFEAKKPNAGGETKCDVEITGDSTDGEMGYDESKMFKGNYEPVDEYGRGTQTDYDGKDYEDLVLAHELGHATGKDDEYEYTGGEVYTAQDNYFGQYYPGMPYHFDQGSMMNKTEAPRMKQLWFMVNRLNDATKLDAELKPLLNETQYRLVHRFTKAATNRVFKYFLAASPNDYRDIHTPFKTGNSAYTRYKPAVPDKPVTATHALIPGQPAVSSKGNFSLNLYKLGEDELSWDIQIGGAHQNFAFDGILAVYIKLAFRFSDYKYRTAPSPGHPLGEVKEKKWTDAGAPDKDTLMNAVKAKIKTLNGRFYLENDGTATDFRRTYIFFFPVALDLEAVAAKAIADDPASAAADFARAHYTIDVIYSNNALVPKPTSYNSIEIGNSVSPEWIARYIFGQDSSWIGAAVNYKGKDATLAGTNKKVRTIASGTAIAYQNSDLDFLKEWIRSELGDETFELRGSAP
ncbi:MAG: hypothetical protein DRP45_04515 [Candidatus Zixiibacteriota bacterium]|nr:MAG: hypothetical protein DRP45_04515 [candidate division Zixibacteria bacterium]